MAGVTYQVAATAWLLSTGLQQSIPGLEIHSVAPEGFEDIDCERTSGVPLLVQTKERGIEARAIAAAETAGIIVHAVPALGGATHFAIVTNGRFGSSLPVTGFDVSLDEALTSEREGPQIRESLLEALRQELDKEAVTTAPEPLLSRIHLATTEGDMAQQTLIHLQHGLDLPPAVASLVRAELLRDLGELAASQREASLETMGRRTLTDLGTIATRISQDVDMPTLEEAIAAGVCEPADYVSPPGLDRTAFLYGVDVVPSHIAAGFDVIRPEETNAVLDGLRDRRDVVIAGPSGSGKSALLWRAARLLDYGVRVVRVLRIADADNVELLVRHVRRQKPSFAARLLVVADDLGRDRMAAWPDARRRLAEVEGVLTLGGVRREDLTPEISSRAVVIDPTLARSSALHVYEALETSGIATVMACDEAINRADGLLMEFIALATTGRRLREVLAEQVERLGTPENRLRREALRLVCAAHVLGSAVPADALPPVLAADADAVGDAMSGLAGEHLVIAEGTLWHGLHDLRAEVLLDLLHTTPPPTMAMTYANALDLLPDSAHGPAARRAAVRIGRETAKSTPDLNPEQRLDTIVERLKPIADMLHGQLTRVATDGRGDDAAAYAASLIEAADRLDTIAYVHAILPFIEVNRPSGVATATLAWLSYSSRVDHLDLDIVPAIVELGSRLPERRSDSATTVTGELAPEQIVRLASGAEIQTAVRLLESAEGLLTLEPAHARDICEAHVESLPDPPGSRGTRDEGDLRAQLTASLAVLAELRGPHVADTFGPVEARAMDAVACDYYGCSVELALAPVEPPSEVAQSHARPFTYGDSEMMTARVVVFARSADAEPIPSAYTTHPGGEPGSLNEQSVLVARRLTDACPEVDHTNVEVWSANCTTTAPTGDDRKSLRTGALRRRPSIARNVAFQAGVAEALSAENWTLRLRSQAQIAQEFIRLLDDLLERLRPYDNAGRRREWILRVQQAAKDVAALPGRPADRKPILGSSRAEALRQTAAEIDEELRKRDPSKDAFATLASSLQQIADNIDNRETLRVAGSRFTQVSDELRKAKDLGMPVFSGIGDTLPEELDERCGFVARLLSALEDDDVVQAVRDTGNDRDRLEQLLATIARSASQEDAGIVATFLSSRDVPARATTIPNDNPIPAWRTFRAALTIELESWAKAMEVLQQWSAEDRAESGLVGQVVVVAIEDEEVLPIGLGFYGMSGDALPLLPPDLESIAEELQLPFRQGTIQAATESKSAELMAYSYERIRRANRDARWSEVPPTALRPQEIQASISADFRDALDHVAKMGSTTDTQGYAGTAATLLIELCDVVANEAGDESGLAAQVTSIDITNLSGVTLGVAGQLYAAARVAAIEADRASR